MLCPETELGGTGKPNTSGWPQQKVRTTEGGSGKTEPLQFEFRQKAGVRGSTIEC